MQQSELCTALKTVCPKVAYRQFSAAEKPPFICYLFTGSDDLMADNANYVPVSGFDVELYTDLKDEALERQLEAELRSLGLTWAKSETFIDTERLHEVVYSISLISTETTTETAPA